MIKDLFGLKDEEYWSDPWRTRKELQRPLMQKGEEGLVLGAPASVALNQHRSFPVALVRVCKLATVARISSRSALILAVIDIETGELRARLALPDTGLAPGASRPARPAAGRDSFSDDDSAMVGEGHTVDLATHLSLPVSRGQYLVTAILLDQVSNRCRMKLVESAGYEDPVVDEFMREYRASRMKLQAVFPEAAPPLPSYLRLDNSPEIPAEPGIALSVTRVQAFVPGARCVVTASYRLAIQTQHVVKPVTGGNELPGALAQSTGTPALGEPAQTAGTPAADVFAQTAATPSTSTPAQFTAPPASSGPAQTARVPISLLLTGSADSRPRVVKLVVPCYEPLESVEGRMLAVGYFSVDLCRIADLLATPQTYFIYAFSGEVMTAAVPTAFARLPDMELDSTDAR